MIRRYRPLRYEVINIMNKLKFEQMSQNSHAKKRKNGFLDSADL